MKKRYVLLIAFAAYWIFGNIAFAAESLQTMHAEDWSAVVLNILAMFGTGGLVAAAVPSKVRQSVPLIKMVINFFGTNFWNAKNKDD